MTVRAGGGVLSPAKTIFRLARCNFGWVTVMGPPDYQAWLSGGTGEGSLASRGDKLFQDLACVNCHKADGSGRGPSLEDLVGKTVDLEGGQKIVVDDEYLRESILSPFCRTAMKRGRSPRRLRARRGGGWDGRTARGRR